MISGTIFGIRPGSARSFAYSSGNWLRNHSPPLIELRVVSLPPTINSKRLPMNSCGRDGRSRVASPCASIEIRSNFGGWLADLPDLGEVGEHLLQHGVALFLRIDLGPGVGVDRADIGPAGQCPSLLKREVEQG